jgi:hypothetical protein
VICRRFLLFLDLSGRAALVLRAGERAERAAELLYRVGAQIRSRP